MEKSNKWAWINDFLTENKMTQAELAKQTGWDKTRISELLTDKRDIASNYIVNFANVLNVDLLDLINYNNGVSKDIPSPKRKVSLKDSVSIKIIDIVACCGTGIEALHENIVGTWDIPTLKFRDFATANPENVYMFQVAGDSMTPTLSSGDWVIADISQNFVSSDGLYLIRTATGLSVKRILSTINSIQIISDNPNYPNFTAEVGEVTILGRIIYILNAHKID